jgi:hypothetical protein
MASQQQKTCAQAARAAIRQQQPGPGFDVTRIPSVNHQAN